MAYLPLAKMITFLLPASLCSAATIVSYSFGPDTASGTTVADVGSTISTLNWNSGGSAGFAETFSSQGAALSVGSFQLSEYYQITLNATGFTGISLNSFRANGSASAPVDWKILYSLTGTSGTFVDATTFSISTATGVSSTTISGFTLPSEADNNASIILRFIATTSTRVDSGSSANGTFRIDNISFEASPVPEPSTAAILAGASVLGFVATRRRRRPAS